MKNDTEGSLKSVATRALIGGTVFMALGAVTVVDVSATQRAQDDSSTAHGIISSIQGNFDLRNNPAPDGLSPRATRAFESKERAHFIYANGCAY